MHEGVLDHFSINKNDFYYHDYITQILWNLRFKILVENWLVHHRIIFLACAEWKFQSKTKDIIYNTFQFAPYLSKSPTNITLG